MWSMCSIDTGHASTHAPHVTQSQIDCSGTPLPTIALRALREHLVADAHDQELRREDLPRRIRGARVLAAAAFGARERVQHFFLRQVEDGRGTEAQLRLGHVEAQRLEPPPRTRAREPDVHRSRRDVQVLRVRQIREERTDDDEMRPDEEPAADLMPAEERQDDERDHREDQVGLAEMRAFEPRRPHDLADDERRDDPGEHEAGEDVAQHAVPLGRSHVTARRRDGGQHDRREQNEEAPEDERVHEPGHEPLQELPLAEHDLDLVSRLPRDVRRAIVRLRAADEPRQEPRSSREEPAADDREHSECDRSYEPRTFRNSALIAGTISCRSPITA